MKLSKDLLKAALMLPAEVVPDKQENEILKHLLINVKDKKLTIKGSDLVSEVSITVDVDAKDQAFTVAGRQFAQMVSLLESEEITLSKTAKNLIVQGGSAKYRVKTLAAEDYPYITFDNNVSAKYEIPGSELARIIKVCSSSAAHSDKDLRTYLCGIYMDFAKGEAVASNGHRLIICPFTSKALSKSPQTVIVPRKTVNLLKHFNAAETISVLVTENAIRFMQGSVDIISPLIVGGFPDYRSMIPTQSQYRLQMNTHSLVGALKRGALFNADRAILDIENSSLTVSSKNSFEDEMKDTLEVVFNKDKIQIGYNPNYLGEYLEILNCEEAVLKFNSAGEPALLEKLKPTKADPICIIMPIRI